jgi:hypothetical protein
MTVTGAAADAASQLQPLERNRIQGPSLGRTTADVEFPAGVAPWLSILGHAGCAEPLQEDG